LLIWRAKKLGKPLRLFVTKPEKWCALAMMSVHAEELLGMRPEGCQSRQNGLASMCKGEVHVAYESRRSNAVRR
ncbi:MAG: hypothetical protein VXZ38_10585, partial [Planctomycetota bacterium]|nr:hypothetical protein [Planctomycetota bacterium]